jgi:hypothetical protein
MAFDGGTGEHTRHLDGDPSNNRLDNLAWGTAADNGADRVLHGTSLCGERHNLAKLSREQVLYIRLNYYPGRGPKLAEMFGVSNSTINNIILGKTWR